MVSSSDFQGKSYREPSKALNTKLSVRVIFEENCIENPQKH